MTVREVYEKILENLLVLAQEIAILTEQVKAVVLWETSWLDANIWLVVFSVLLYGQYIYFTYQNYVDHKEDFFAFTIMQCFYTGMLYVAYKLLTAFP